KILSEHKEGHARLAETLLTKEVMYAEDLKEIFGPRQWRSRTEEIMRLQAERDAAREAELAQSDPSANDTPADAGNDGTGKVIDVEATEVSEVPVEESSDTDKKDSSDTTTPPPFKGV
ncbi:MAG: cell division protein FtsH, partial [Duncaniella sp.]|nr:cell division protein FtsH [Duncaniella sp.]